MLTMGVVDDVGYYLEDYYLDSGDSPGGWYGKGAVLLGLSGDIQEEQFRNVMMGYSPDGRTGLCRNPGENHRPGWDMCFSAPKSVSVAWARADDKLKPEIEAACQAAAKRAIQFLEKHAAYTRKSKDGVCREQVAGLVVSMFDHCTSRALDPQLHIHCVVANAAPRLDGSWGTIESRDLFLWQKAAGAVYRSELSKSIRELGFAVERDDRAFKLAGIPQEICDYYSKRAEVIKKALAALGSHSSASKVGDYVALSTRDKKENISREDLFATWSKELDEQGFEETGLDSIRKDSGLDFDLMDLGDDTDEELSVEYIKNYLTEKDSFFREQDVYRVAAELSQYLGDGFSQANAVAKDFFKDSEIISLGMDAKNCQIYTTEEILRLEKAAIKYAKSLRESRGFELSAERILNSIDAASYTLSEEQKEAVFGVCGRQAFSIMQGSAGAGKSTSMQCVRSSYESAGYKVIGAAIAKSAANNLFQEAGVESHTVAKLLIDIDAGRSPLDEKTVLLVDEAGQLGTKQLHGLLMAAGSSGSKVVLVGEDKQLEAIQHGGFLRYLSRPETMGTTRIETIRRQREEWARVTVANFRDGNARQSLDTYASKGFLNWCKDSGALKQELVSRWDQFRKANPEKKSIILAQRWRDVAELNAHVRSILQAEGAVSTNEIDVSCCVSDRRIKYKMAQGERIRFTKNDYRRDFTNGDLATVLAVEQLESGDIEFKLQMDSGRTVRILGSEYCNEQGDVYFTQAYALTVYSSQGLTVDGDSFVYYTSGMDRAHSYVACSRHKDNCHLFVNAKEIRELTNEFEADIDEHGAMFNALAKQMSADNKKKLAVELMDELHCDEKSKSQSLSRQSEYTI